jgi:hypothetical protein
VGWLKLCSIAERDKQDRRANESIHSPRLAKHQGENLTRCNVQTILRCANINLSRNLIFVGLGRLSVIAPANATNLKSQAISCRSVSLIGTREGQCWFTSTPRSDVATRYGRNHALTPAQLAVS